MEREEFKKAYGRDSADYAHAIISGHGEKYTPEVGSHTTKTDNVDSIMD